MATLTHDELMRAAARKLRADFEELVSVPHNQLRGQEAERLFSDFIRQRLPRRFDVSGGFIMDIRDAVSRQTDVIVYDALNCPPYRSSESAGIFPSDNVAAVIEVKSNLTAAELKDGFEKIRSVKSLSKTKLGHVDPARYERIQTLGCVFAFRSELTLQALTDAYVKELHAGGLGHHVDLVAVLDFGVLQLASRPPGFPSWAPTIVDGVPPLEGAHVGVCAIPAGTNTLDLFMRLLMSNLTVFRPFVPHKGFLMTNDDGERNMLVQYLFSTTNEKDPVKREAKLAAYSAAMEAEFASMSTIDMGPIQKFKQRP